MSDVLDEELYRRAEALLEPGEIGLIGCLVHTDLAGEEDLEMQELTVAINEVIAANADANGDGNGDASVDGDAGESETYIYAGNGDPEFASNQFQGRRIDDESFVWECQQLLRGGTFDLVFYYGADADQAAIVEGVSALDHVEAVTPVPEPHRA